MNKPSRDLWFIGLFIILFLAGIALLVVGIVQTGSTTAAAAAPTATSAGAGELIAAGAACIIFIAALFPFIINMVFTRPRENQRLADLLSRNLDLLGQIQEHTLLSDSAKRIAYRRDERNLLRRAIEEDIANEDWSAALVLVDDMRERFGYREEAEDFRARIEQRRSDVMNRRITEALQHFESIVSTYDWSSAYAESAKIQRLFPESHRVRGLEQRVRQAWEDRKQSLEREFLDKASHSNVDDAMRLLKELDQYLTPREARPLQEVARGVVNKARENVGLQFKLAIQDHDWITAVRVGESIIDEFPNTTMANEVRERIDVLRSRAQTQSLELDRRGRPQQHWPVNATSSATATAAENQ